MENKNVLIYADDARREILREAPQFAYIIDRIKPVDAVEVAECEAVVYKLECLLCHATGGKYSKAGYLLEDMERMVTDYIEECCEEAVAEEVVYGRWIVGGECNHVPRRIKNPDKWVTYKCSICGYSNGRKQSNYCPNCGAKMDGDGNGN